MSVTKFSDGQPRLPLVAGNWKMNGDPDGFRAFATELSKAVVKNSDKVESLICPPSPLLALATNGGFEPLSFGGQDCHASTSGAHTGDTSANLLAALDCQYVILGHSERRADHGETDAEVRAKAQAAAVAGLSPIVCIGETKEQRESGKAEDVVLSQLRASIPTIAAMDLVVAYEPVWAIGTGLTASPEDIAAMHLAIREELVALFANETGEGSDVRLLYGGSVKATNAEEIFSVPNVDGALVGGASLAVESFLPIIEAMANRS